MEKEAMRRKKVESSNIHSIGHNFLTKNMEIEFKNGGIYRYKKVPRAVFKEMLDSDSKGRFFWKNVRFEYPYKKYRDKDGNKVEEEWKMLEKKAGITNTEKAAIIGGTVGAVGGAINGAGAVLASPNKIGKKERFKMAVKQGSKTALLGGVAGAATGATQSAITQKLNEKKASEVLNEMIKEAAIFNGTGSAMAVGSAIKGITNSYKMGAGGMTGSAALKGGLSQIGKNTNRIVGRTVASGVVGNLLETGVNNITKPADEDEYGRRVSASEILDELYKEAGGADE